jgi:hypothetical protein
MDTVNENAQNADDEQAQVIDLSDVDEKIIAVMQLVGTDDPTDITDEGNNRYSYYREEYLVLTDSEADSAQDEELENYIDECILSELPEAYRSYFDDESWKRDARMDGRGHVLSSYDGSENEEKVNGTWYYIYRTN